MGRVHLTAGETMSSNEIPPFQEGQRVEFGADLRRGSCSVPAGATAVVDYVDACLLTLRLENPLPGLEEVEFTATEFATAIAILRVLAEAPARRAGPR